MVEANPSYHNTKGPQPFEHLKLDNNGKILEQAYQEIGYKLIDPNGPSQIGAVHYQVSAKHYEVTTTNAAYIRPIRKKRSNLKIETEAHVTRIIIDPVTKTATGVEYYSAKNNLTKVALAHKEVIVSAGTVNSPKLLLLSGIGPANELRKHEIDVIQESAVGRNLANQVTTRGLTVMLNKTATIKSLQDIEKDCSQWLNNRSGPLTHLDVASFGALFQTSLEKSRDLPNIRVVNLGANLTPDSDKSIYSVGLPGSFYNGISIRPTLMTPKSRGYVKLNKTDPIWGRPLINPRYLEDPADLDALVYAVMKSLELFKTKAFLENGYQLVDDPLPACKQHEFSSQNYWKCVVMQMTEGEFINGGTCKMGPKHDPGAVVNPRLRVYGVKRLRVVDTSIMPSLPRGSGIAVALMIAEKASAMIKEDWKKWTCDKINESGI